MEVTSLNFYPPSWRGRPPAIQRNDWPIWLSFLDAEGASYEGFAYDVELPTTAPPPIDASPGDLAMWTRLTAKRIDALAKKGSDLTIIELRPRVSFQTMGQLIGYSTLFPTAFPAAPKPHLLIVAATTDQDMDKIVAAQGIAVLLYPQPRFPGQLAT